MQKLNQSMRDLFEDQWQHVQLTRMPSGGGAGGGEGGGSDGRRRSRERAEAAGLHEVFEYHFSGLFDVYLYYAIADPDENASELYKMTESRWKQLLRDSKLLPQHDGAAAGGGDGSGAPKQLKSMLAAQIFRDVNQRRDNLETQKGDYAKAGPASASTTVVTSGLGDTGLTRAVFAEAGGIAADGGGSVTSSVTRSHYHAGALNAFTFSEFLEGLMVVALEAYPQDPGEGSGAEAVKASVEKLVKRVLSKAKRANVLEFRRMVTDSTSLQAVLSEIAGPLQTLYDIYASGPKKIGRGPNCAGAEATAAARIGAARGTLSLARFFDLCQDAGLIGSSLSNHQAKMAFVHSLVISPEGEGPPRRPLLNPGEEFHEAILRLVAGWNPQGAGSWQYQMDPMRESLATPKGTPRKGGRQATPGTYGNVAGTAKAASRTMSEAVERVTNGEVSGEEHSILMKLPDVCGKLVALTMDAGTF